MSTRRFTNIPANDNERIVESLRAQFDMSGCDPSEMFDRLALAVKQRVWESRGLTFEQFLEASYPQGIGVKVSAVEAWLLFDHREEAGDPEVRARMVWLRQSVLKLLGKSTIEVDADDPQDIADTLRQYLTPEQVAQIKEAL